MHWFLHLNLDLNVTAYVYCDYNYVSDYFNFCCFRAMTLSLLHLFVNWQVFTIYTMFHPGRLWHMPIFTFCSIITIHQRYRYMYVILVTGVICK